MTETMPRRADLRDCRRYRFYGWDPRTDYSTKTLIYIGETGRWPFERLMEHVADQPWADTITLWEVDDAIYPGKVAVVEAERQAIEDELPLYNYEFNLGNPHRVEIWRAKEQRWARDDAASRPRWRPPVRQARERASGSSTAPRPAPVRRSPVRKPVRRWKPWQRRALGWFTTWAGLVVACWIAALAYHLGGWQQTGSVSAAVWAVLFGWIMCGCPWPAGSSRRARRWRRRLWR